MDEICFISSLPVEMIEEILECKEISVHDVLNFGYSCSGFYDVIKMSNRIWKAKFKQRWPQLTSHKYYKNCSEINWHEEVKQRYVIGKETMELVATMSPLHVMDDELSPEHFVRYEVLKSDSDHELAISFMIDELMCCIHCENRDLRQCKGKIARNLNLTNKYYSKKVLNHLRQIDLRRKWEEFKNTTPENQILEYGAVIIAQWCQPTEDITEVVIGSQLNSLAKNVLDAIRLEYGDEHPALNVPSELQRRWQSQNIPDNFYTPNVSWQVLQSVANVLFKEMGFQGDSLAYYSPDNSYINKVLENHRGIPITLAIVFESVARRLGVKCEPVSFPGHFLLRWRDSYRDNTPTKYHYIDVFNGGVLVEKDNCPRFASLQGYCPTSDILRFGPATTLQVVERMATNLEVAGRQRSVLTPHSTCLRSALELLNMINPCNIHVIEELSKYYMEYNMDVGSIMDTINKMAMLDLRQLGQATALLISLQEYNFQYHHSPRNNDTKVKRRKGMAIEFAVGMVMRHKRYNYTCAIIGWDPQCSASEEWIIQMNVKSLKKKERQPFYNVLASDGSVRYAAEENLLIETPGNCWITHGDIGRYFQEFHDTYYEMNQEMKEMYPDDALFLLEKFTQ